MLVKQLYVQLYSMTMAAAAAAVDVGSDPQHQHLQQVPWKQVLPEHRGLPTGASEPSACSSYLNWQSYCDKTSSSRARDASKPGGGMAAAAAAAGRGAKSVAEMVLELEEPLQMLR